MKYLLFLLVFVSPVLYGQSVPLTPLLSAAELDQQKQKPVKDKVEKKPKKIEAPEVVIPLGKDVLPTETFRPYKPKPVAVSEAFKYSSSGLSEQKNVKASVIGVNVNTWLENPEIYKALEEEVKLFPFEIIFDNIVAYTPYLTLNDPLLVAQLVNTDIYSPYLKNAVAAKMPRLFSEYKSVVSFTRNYHIYGVAAGGLPYFGTPSEGADRRINLSLIKGQITEYAVKLPDTDVFLAVVVNITPNWLEEGWDVRQINRQSVEVIVYAFNRKGKLLGGAGLPQNFFQKGRFITVEQKIYSGIWQASVPRVFYVWPSFKIINTPKPNTVKISPDVTLPTVKTPSLNKAQKYILASINNLRDRGESISRQLFDDQGEFTYKKVIIAPKIDTNKHILGKRKLSIVKTKDGEIPDFPMPDNVLKELNGSLRPKLDTERVLAANEIAQKKALEEEAREKELKALKEIEKEAIAREASNKKAEAKVLKKAKAEAKALEKANKKAEVDTKAKEKLSFYRNTEQNALYRAPIMMKAQNIGAVVAKADAKAKKEARKKEEAELKALRKKEEKNTKIQSAKELEAAENKLEFATKSVLLRKYFPSNEKEKLVELLRLLPFGLKEDLFFTTNDRLAVTNQMSDFEIESDPSVYHSKRRKYYSALASSGVFRKEFNQETKLLKKALIARLDDELFFAKLHKKIIENNALWTLQLNEAFKVYQEAYVQRKKIELSLFEYDRNEEFMKQFKEKINDFGKRELEEYKRTAKNIESFEKKEKINQEHMNTALKRYAAPYLSPSYAKSKQQKEVLYVNSVKDFETALRDYQALVPSSLKVFFLGASQNPIELMQKNKEAWTSIAALNRVPLEVIVYAEINNISYPTKRFRKSLSRKAMSAYRKNMRFISYEGFMLGLTESWSVKTGLADRLDGL